MKKLNLSKFNKATWLLNDSSVKKIQGGAMSSECGTKCTTTENENGSWDMCCDDTEKD